MRKRTKILVALCAVSGALATVACASHRHHRGHGAEHAEKFVTHRVDRMLSKIDATDAQRADVNRVKDHLFAEFQAAHAGSEKAKQTFFEQWQSQEPDAEKLHALAEERVLAYQKVAHEMVDGMIAVHRSLDEQQRATIAKQWKEHAER